ncbi:hypothetical protein F5H01DRAFT_315777 [Linnemannia elongata]|nr:hypothetical protein F5H01DRAFT_315777 [Linnemannia elongata]
MSTPLLDEYRWRYIEFNIPCLDLGPKGEILDNFLGPSSLEAVRKNSNRIRTLGVKAQDLVQLLLLENDQGHGHGQGIANRISSGLRPRPCLRDPQEHPTLSSQGVAWLSLSRLCKVERSRNAEATVMDSDRMYEWRQFESLRILSVDCQYGVCESWVHHPILKNAPLLKYLKTGCYVDIEDEDNDITDFAGYRHTLVVVSTACPEIQHLHVQHGGWDPVITAAELVSLIQAYPKGLKALNFEMPESGQEEVISALLNSSASTLKSVVIEHYPNVPPVSKEAVARMVEECPQLEELDINCQCHTDPSVECLHVELEAFAEAQGKPYDDSR